MLYGVGQTVITTNDLNANSLVRQENALFPQCLASFEMSVDTTSADARCMKKGVMTTTASALTGETFTLTLNYQFNDWTNLQLLLGEVATTEANVSIPVVKQAIIADGTTVGVVTDSDVTTASEAGVLITNTSSSIQYELTIGTAGTPTAGNAEVDSTLGQLTFPVGDIGQTVEYVIDKVYTSIDAIGAALETDILTNLSFVGLIATTVDGVDGYQIVVPRLERISTPTITLAGDTAELTVEYRLVTPPGKRKPFALYRLNTATAA